jgi:integrase
MPKTVPQLTDPQLKNAKPKEKPYKLSDGKGLYLEVMPTGSKLWRLKFKQANGKENRLTYGNYPAMSLAAARIEREKDRDLLGAGTDPRESRKETYRLSKDAAAQTFEKLAREWHTKRRSTWSDKHADKILRRLEVDIFPEIGAMPIGTIEHRHMMAALHKIEARRALEVAHRVKAFCARIFSYANQQGIKNSNPAADLKDVLIPVNPGNYAAITPDELPAFLKAISSNEARLYKPTRIAVRLMMLLFVRTSELIETPWSEIDLENEVWIIPWPRMKMGKRKVKPVKVDHQTCLPRQGWQLLRELHALTGRCKYLFPNQRDHERPMSNGAILMALRRMGYQGKMTGHGFRSLAMGVAKEKLNYRHEVPNRQLAHKSTDTLGEAYDRSAFLDERKKMMQSIADYYDAIEASGKVIPANLKTD